MDDVVIQDDELEQFLEDRQEAKKAIAEYNALDKKTKAKIDSMQPPPPYRIGRFVISKSPIPPKDVSFHTGESSRISIKLLGDE